MRHDTDWIFLLPLINMPRSNSAFWTGTGQLMGLCSTSLSLLKDMTLQRISLQNCNARGSPVQYKLHFCKGCFACHDLFESWGRHAKCHAAYDGWKQHGGYLAPCIPQFQLWNRMGCEFYCMSPVVLVDTKCFSEKRVAHNRTMLITSLSYKEHELPKMLTSDWRHLLESQLEHLPPACGRGFRLQNLRTADWGI